MGYGRLQRRLGLYFGPQNSAFFAEARRLKGLTACSAPPPLNCGGSSGATTNPSYAGARCLARAPLVVARARAPLVVARARAPLAAPPLRGLRVGYGLGIRLRVRLEGAGKGLGPLVTYPFPVGGLSLRGGMAPLRVASAATKRLLREFSSALETNNTAYISQFSLATSFIL